MAYLIPKRAKKPRVYLDMTVAARAAVDDLMERSGAVSISALMRTALAVYDRVVEAEARGARLVIREADGKDRELVIVSG